MPGIADRLRQIANDPRNKERLQKAVNSVQQQARKPENQQRIAKLRDRFINRRPGSGGTGTAGGTSSL